MSEAAPSPPSRPGRQTGAAPWPPAVEVHDRVQPIAEEWDDLAERLRAPLFLRPGWIAAWWRAFGRGRLEIVTLRRSGRLAALVPMQRRFGQLWSTSNWHTPTFGMLAADQAAADELAGTLFARQPAQVCLSFVPGDGCELASCRAAAAAARYRVLERTLERSPFLVVDGTWDAYRERLSRNRRKQLGRRRRALEREGRLEFQIVDGRDHLDDLGPPLEEFFQLEALAWKGAAGTAITSRAETRRFYTEVGRWAAERGWFRLAFLRLDGRPLAVHYLLEEGGVLHTVKGGFDPAFARFSPGMLLLEAVLAHAFEAGLCRVALLGGDEAYKVTFTKDVEERVRFQAFAPSVAGAAEWAAFMYGRPLAKRALGARRRG